MTNGQGLHVEALSAWYGQARVLRDISIEVPAGAVVALFGHNGAGKSTLLRSIAGVHVQRQGIVRIGDQRLDDKPAHTAARAGLMLVREGARVFDTMTVAEHIDLGLRLAALSGRPQRTDEEVYGMFPVLAGRRSMRAGYLSGGQRQMLSLATAFAAQPTFLLLDEPSAGLAPVVAAEIFTKAAELAQSGVAVLVAEQNPRWLQDVAGNGYVLETGSVVLTGSIESLVSHTFTGAAAGSTE